MEGPLVKLLMSALGLLALAGGAWRWGLVRGPVIVTLALIAVASSLATVFFLYGGVAWSSRGGGTLLLFALPAGVAAWVSFSVLGVVWESRKVQYAVDWSLLLDALKRLRR